MLAIMCPSGAGKTTLLSLISQRSNQGLQISGEVKQYRFRLWLTGLVIIQRLFINLEHLSIRMTFLWKH